MTDTSLATVATAVNKHPIVILRERLEARKDELQKQLGNVSADVFIRGFMTAAMLDANILGCTWQSIYNALLRACRDRLIPDGQQGAVVAFKSNATWIPMTRGLMLRFQRSGQFKWIAADVVHAGEEFIHYRDEDGEHFRHVPSDSFDAPITNAYAIAKTLNGGTFIEVLSLKELEKIRATSRATREDSPWRQWPAEMMKKTALRRLSKRLPMDGDLFMDEDLSELEVPATTPTPIARAPGAAAALDQFSRAVPAGDNPHPVATDDAGQEGGEQGMIEASAATDHDPAAVDDHYEHFQLVAAYKRGQEAKAAGHARKAIPPEFRELDATQQALAWEAGWSGQPMPEWKFDE
jgi:recombination protein RecT